MSSTHLLLGDLARSKILTGATALADAPLTQVPDKGPKRRGAEEPDLA